MIRVKICGLTNEEDALKACDYGADLLGFIFVKGTPRFVEADKVKDIVASINAKVKHNVGKVGVFRDEDPAEIIRTVADCGLDYVQLHGREHPDECKSIKEVLNKRYDVSVKIIKAFKIADDIIVPDGYRLRDYESADFFVFDTFSTTVSGGTGITFSWDVLKREMCRVEHPFFIAGGLDPQNVTAAINEIHPFGVDVSSGVELEVGKKDEDLLKEFIQNAKNT